MDWAAAALESSSNQPVLPHAIIVLNASEYDIDPGLWDVDTSTSRLFENLSRTVFHNATFKKYAQFSGAIAIDRLKQLNSSFIHITELSMSFVYLPAAGQI